MNRIALLLLAALLVGCEKDEKEEPAPAPAPVMRTFSMTLTTGGIGSLDAIYGNDTIGFVEVTNDTTITRSLPVGSIVRTYAIGGVYTTTLKHYVDGALISMTGANVGTLMMLKDTIR